ncbi:MAG: hypothetical protein KAJ52_03850 [Sedimentisphaerales bacterium]|nr:hypothetical protein [Sedimentisphaerales bacterium]
MVKQFSALVVWVFTLFIAVTASGQNIPPTYEIIAIDHLGGGIAWDKEAVTKGTAGLGLNNLGQIAGGALTPDGKNHAFLWDKNTGITNIEPVFDIDPIFGWPYSESIALDINDNSQIIIDGYLADYNRGAFFWDSTFGTIELFDSSLALSGAYALNNSAQVVGVQIQPMVGPAAYLWQDLNGNHQSDIGEVRNIIPSNVSTNRYAKSINDTEQVVGTYRDSGDCSRAFLWQNDNMIDLGTLDGSHKSWANDINTHGQVVGESGGLPRPLSAFIWEDVNGNNQSDLGEMQKLDDLGAYNFASAVNDSSLVVGRTQLPDGSLHAVLWDGGTLGITDLNDLLPENSEWEVLCEAIDINDLGQIAGYGKLDSGEYRIFLMTPIPEPCSIFLWGLGALAFGVRRAKKS